MTITGLRVGKFIMRSFTKIFNCMHVLNQITTLKNILALEKKVINQEYYLCSRKWAYIKYD